MEHQQPQPRPPLEQAQLNALWKACDSDDTAALAHLVEMWQATPSDVAQGFWSAIDHSHPNMVRYLLEKGVDHVDGYIIERALKVGSIPVLEVLREHGWDDIDMKLSKVALSALFYATHNPAIVSYLLKLGANPNLGPAAGGGLGTANRFHFIPNSGAILQSAARNGSIESLDILLKHGAILSNAEVLHAAVEGGSIAMMAHLLKLGVDVDQTDSYWQMGLPVYKTPLLRAISNGKADVVKFLLENGASTTKKTTWLKVETALDMVKNNSVSNEIRQMVEDIGERD